MEIKELTLKPVCRVSPKAGIRSWTSVPASLPEDLPAGGNGEWLKLSPLLAVLLCLNLVKRAGCGG